MSTALDGLTPIDLGLPDKFSNWRKYQPRAVSDTMADKHRFVGLCLPAGAGKSPVYLALHQLTSARMVALTSTKGLQTQLFDDFSSIGMLDVRGKANYDCQMYNGTCDDHADHCSLADDVGCPYRAAYVKACAADLVVTNYQYWFAVNMSNGLMQRDRDTREPVNPVEMLVLDEAHHAENELERFLKITIRAKELEKAIGEHRMPPRKPGVIPSWVAWAKDVAPEVVRVVKELEQYEDSNEKSAELRKLNWLLERLVQVGKLDSTWIVEYNEEKGVVEFTPVWVGRYAEQYLFCGVPKVVCVSATLRQRTISNLGVKSSSIGFHEYPCEFPSGRCPIYKVPGAKVSKGSGSSEMKKLVEKIDSIIEGRRDRKGIIQTVSYKLQKEITTRSEYRDMMLWNVAWSRDGSANAEAVVKRFKEASEPCLMVSPSLATGYDFPMAECEYVIVAKVPFPDISGRVFQERRKRDSRLGSYIAMQTLMQASRRGMRSKKDRCEVFIVDENFNWFWMQNRDMAASWFSPVWRREVPRAPRRLQV